jgi:hypothetical protein
MGPHEIGFAAAYEAYRQIKYGANVYNNLYTDYERQREALRALAIAEGLSLSIFLLSHASRGFHFYQASRLWQDTGHGYDQYGLQAACDAAAATAGHITSERELEESQGYGMGLGVGSFRDRRNSFGALSASGYAGSGYGGGGSVFGGGSPLQMARSIPGSPILGSSPIAISNSPYVGGGYAGSAVSYGGGYPGSYSTPGYDYLGLPSPGGFGGGYLSAPGTPASVIIQPESHHRRHRHRHHHHHHHRRHRSHDRY